MGIRILRFVIAFGLCATTGVPANAASELVGPVVPIVGTGWVQTPYVLPIGVSDQLAATYGTLSTYTLNGAWLDDWLGLSNFGLVDLGNGNVRDQIAGTVQNTAHVGEMISTMPGNKMGHEQQGMDARLAASDYQDGQYSRWVADGYATDPRVTVCLFIHQEAPVGGSRDITVVGFAGYYIDRFDYGTKKISGAFTSLPEAR